MARGLPEARETKEHNTITQRWHAFLSTHVFTESMNHTYFSYVPITPDEFTWTGIVVLDAIWNKHIYVLLYFFTMPIALYHVLAKVSIPGDEQRPGNNIIMADLRKETQASKDVKEVIANPIEYEKLDQSGKLKQLLDGRGEHAWVRTFKTQLAPDSFADTLTKEEQWRNVGLLAQGEFYCGKADFFTPVMAFVSVILLAIGCIPWGVTKSLRVAAVTIVMVNQEHILRDHSISGFTHHMAHNVGEFDKREFREYHLKRTKTISALFFFTHALKFAIENYINAPGMVIVMRFIAQMFNMAFFVNTLLQLGFVNHTVCHTNVNAVQAAMKRLGENNNKRIDTLRLKAWVALFWAQQALANMKLVCSVEYHKKHHFHVEMSCPGILAPLNEFLTSMALHKLKDCRLEHSSFERISSILTVTGLFVAFLVAYD